MSKLLENTFRLVNISFINELTTLCVEMNIDINEVIDAASSKPYGFLPFRPSFGAGGHCIPVDPVYLTEFAMSKGIALRTVELAKEVNSDQVNFYIDLVNRKLGSLIAKRILVIGLAYKANLSDVRETPVKKLIESLRNSGADVKWHDELVKSWEGEESTPITLNFDLAIVATKHDYINLTSLQGLQILTANGLFS